jgi:hypothetical protein
MHRMYWTGAGLALLLRHSICLSFSFHAGSFKLADFGLARIFGSPDRNLTPRVSHKMPAM